MINNPRALRIIYSMFALLWFAALVLIERMGPGFVRFYAGDVMVTGFLFWCVLAVKPSLNAVYLGLSILVVALIVEVLQLFRLEWLREILGRKTSNLVLGNNFDWGDVLAYVIGLLISVGIYHLIGLRTNTTNKTT